MNTPKPEWSDPPAVERSRAAKLEDLRQKTIRYELNKVSARANRAPANRLYTGERGGRYYKRTRPDGTTYREYTF